jgi:hypothetical protein
MICPYFEPIWFKIVDESELNCANAVPSFYQVMMSLILQFKYYYGFVCMLSHLASVVQDL